MKLRVQFLVRVIGHLSTVFKLWPASRRELANVVVLLLAFEDIFTNSFLIKIIECCANRDK